METTANILRLLFMLMIIGLYCTLFFLPSLP